MIDEFLVNQIQISEDVFSYFSDFVHETQPSEENSQLSDDYDKGLHEIGASIFRLASFLVNHQDQNQIVLFLKKNYLSRNKIHYRLFD